MEQKRFLEAHVKAVDDPKWPHGSFEATLSMPTIDRDHEVIDADAFEPLPKSIPIFGDHVATIATTVARAVPQYDGAVLKAVGRFASDDYSQMVRQKVKDGFVDSMSVGFMAPQYDTDDNGVMHITKGELLEASFVPIPSLREATVSMAKHYASDLLEAAKLKTGETTGWTRKGPAITHAVKDTAIQKAHDALTEAGAQCWQDQEDSGNNQRSVLPIGATVEVDALLVELAS